jgi:flagellar protein FliT
MESITTVDQLFMCYDTILQVTGQMLSAARKDDWDTSIELQKRYSALVDTLRPVCWSFTFDAQQRARVEDLTRRILSDETEVRNLAAPRLARLSALLASGRQSQAMQKMYGLSARG